MIKNIIATSLVVATLVFSGCGSSEGEEALSVQQQLDNRDFTGAISSLEGKATTDGKKMQLGAAYMGAAGLSTTDLVEIISDTTVEDISLSSAPQRVSIVDKVKNSKAFARFAEVLQELAEKEPKMFEYVSKATTTFEKVSDKERSKSVGFALGLANTARATLALSYLGDMKSIVDGTGASGDLKASACAVAYMYAGRESSRCLTYTETPKEANEDPFDTLKITLREKDGSIGTYLRLVSGTAGRRTGGDVYIHKNYIDAVTGEETPDSNDGLNYPKVIVIDDEPITVKNTLVKALNKGFGKASEFAPEDVREKILRYQTAIDSNEDGVIESSELGDYLERKLDEVEAES